MAGRERKQKQYVEVCDTAKCVKELDLSNLTAKINFNESVVGDIKDSLNRMVATHEVEKKQSDGKIDNLTTQITKLSTTMDQYVETTKTLVENQTKMLEQLNKIMISNQTITVQQTNTAADMNKHIDASEKWKADIDTRLRKLEERSFAIYAIGGFLLSLVNALAYLSQMLHI